MKKLLALVLLLSIAPLMGQAKQGIPTPQKAISFNANADTVKWKVAHVDGNQTVIIAEMVPEGHDIKAWKEMVSQQIVFAKVTPKQHTQTWKKLLKKSDPEIELTEEVDGEVVTVTYKSKRFNEYCVTRFMAAKDGVYAIAYNIRLSNFDQKRVDLWKGILKKSALIDNPEYK